MAGKKPQLGTLTIKEGSHRTTYPVHRAGFGVLTYTATNEIWFDVGAGHAIAGDKPSKDDEYEPRMNATVYADKLDASHLSGLKLSIPAPFEALQRPHSDAYLHYYADYGEPDALGPCTIRIGQVQDGLYQVRWTATLDSYNSRPKPGSQIDIELNATFLPVEVVDVPGTQKEADFNNAGSPYVWLMFPILLVGSFLGAIFPMFPGYFLLLYFGAPLGFVIASILRDRKYRKIVRATERQTPKQEGSNQAEADNDW